MTDDVAGIDTPARPGRTGWVLPPEIDVQLPPGVAYAGFWRRFWAYLIDQLILAVPTFAIYLLAILGPLALGTYGVFGSAGASRVSIEAALEGLARLVVLAFAATFAFQLLYHALFWSRRGATPGQSILGIEIRSEVDGSRISFSRACLRYLGCVVSSWILYIGFIWVAFDPRKQGWHDKMAGTVAIRRIG